MHGSWAVSHKISLYLRIHKFRNMFMYRITLEEEHWCVCYRMTDWLTPFPPVCLTDTLTRAWRRHQESETRQPNLNSRLCCLTWLTLSASLSLFALLCFPFHSLGQKSKKQVSGMKLLIFWTSTYLLTYSRSAHSLNTWPASFSPSLVPAQFFFTKSFPTARGFDITWRKDRSLNTWVSTGRWFRIHYKKKEEQHKRKGSYHRISQSPQTEVEEKHKTTS